jgi:hypothetical protein
MQSIDAPLQVVILVFEAVGGLVAGQQGLALVARLTSSRTLEEEREAGIAQLVASGKVTVGLLCPFRSYSMGAGCCRSWPPGRSRNIDMVAWEAEAWAVCIWICAIWAMCTWVCAFNPFALPYLS